MKAIHKRVKTHPIIKKTLSMVKNTKNTPEN